MKMFYVTLVAAVAMFVGSVQSVQAESKVTLSDMHLCCAKCVKAVEAAVAGVDGAKVAVDKAARSATVTAKDDETVAKAVAAIGDAGFHGSSDNKEVAMKDDSGAKAGKVKRVELTGVHNCCGGCNVAIVKAIDSVKGVKANTAKPKQSTVVVEGEFDATEVVAALNKAGFHVKVKAKAKK